MLKLFRSIRKKLIEQNNIRKYLLYAIGEILLVVIGILIALQVNNWNEKRNEAKITESILYNLKVDIDKDLENLGILRDFLTSRKRDADYVLTVIQDSDVKVDKANMINALTHVGWILNYTPTFATYNEITNSGRLSLIASDELKKRLADYKSQVAESQRINEAYEPGLKEAEKLALSFMSRVPEANNLSTEVPANTNVDLDIARMRTNQTFINQLKHISFHTATDILYNDELIIPRAEAIREILEEIIGGG
jgi:hypothetical protein